MNRNLLATLLFLYCPLVAAIDLVIELENKALNPELEKAFNERGVPYRLNDEGVFYYPEEYYSLAHKLPILVIENDLPSERSISFPDPEALEVFVNELRAREVPYVKKTRSGSVWVVWAPGHEVEAEEASSKVNEFVRAKIKRHYED